jgi:hypothetical protein
MTSQGHGLTTHGVQDIDKFGRHMHTWTLLIGSCSLTTQGQCRTGSERATARLRCDPQAARLTMQSVSGAYAHKNKWRAHTQTKSR